MPTVPTRISARHTYWAAESVSRRKIRPRTTTRTMLDPAHTALARDAGIVRVANENSTNPRTSASTPPSNGPGRSKPWALPSSTTPVASASTVTTRKTMPWRGPGVGGDTARNGSAGSGAVATRSGHGHRVADDGRQFVGVHPVQGGEPDAALAAGDLAQPLGAGLGEVAAVDHGEDVERQVPLLRRQGDQRRRRRHLRRPRPVRHQPVAEHAAAARRHQLPVDARGGRPHQRVDPAQLVLPLTGGGEPRLDLVAHRTAQAATDSC